MKSSTRLAAICLLPLFLLLCSCEQTVDVDTPYVERLVVSGVLQTGGPLRVSISRTLPLDRPIDRSASWIGDVNASVVIDAPGGTSARVPLVYSGDSSIYTTDQPLEVVAGNRYRLEAEWKSLRVAASTTAPFPIPIDSIWLASREHPYEEGADVYTFVVRFRPIGEQIYRLAYDLTDFGGGGSISFFGRDVIKRRKDTLSGGYIDLMFEGYLEIDPKSVDAILHTFDEPYYDFYTTYYLDTFGDGAFSGGSDLTRWNVEGDGIGLFVGQATTRQAIE